MAIIIMFAGLFLVSFLAEYGLLGLKGLWKLLGAAPLAAVYVLMVRSGSGSEYGCGMPQLIMAVLVSPVLVGMALAGLARVLRWVFVKLDQE